MKMLIILIALWNPGGESHTKVRYIKDLTLERCEQAAKMMHEKYNFQFSTVSVRAYCV